MTRTGFARPGAVLIVLAVVIAVLAGIGPIFMAMGSPTHWWGYEATGFGAFLLSSLGLLLAALYIVGCILYTRSKGYSAWIGFWLSLGHFAGLLAMLLLPDQLVRMGSTERADRETAQAV